MAYSRNMYKRAEETKDPKDLKENESRVIRSQTWRRKGISKKRRMKENT